MSRTLTLTSPMMRGHDVERAQMILKNKGFFVGEIDGIFGEITGRACTDAKYQLGYASKNIKPSYGKDLEAFLTGKKKPTPAMRVRASQRQKKKPLGLAALAVAKQYVGVKEDPPNSNRVLFSEWYGLIGPWCAMFVTYCFVKAGSKAFARGERWAYCPYMLQDARQNRNGLTVVPHKEARRGDIALFSWKRDGVANHVGIVVTAPGDGSVFTSIEGNTSTSSDSDGGEVQIRQRNTYHVIAFVRPVR